MAISWELILAAVLIVSTLMWAASRVQTARRPATAPTPVVDVRTAEQQLSAEDHAQVSAHVAANQEIQAIKLVRERLGLGLLDAKLVVDRWGRSTSAEEASESMEAVARTTIAGSGKIAAIKYVRQQTGWGLVEAKSYVDGLDSIA